MTTPILIGAGVLLLISVVASKAARVGVPALIIFLCIGMLAGSDGPGGIPFDNPQLAQGLGIAALAFILFGGGLDTRWEDVRPALGSSVRLATIGTLITAGVTGAFATIAVRARIEEVEGLFQRSCEPSSTLTATSRWW